MPKTTNAHHKGAPITFEEIAPRLRPQAIAAYLCLLDEGYDPERITFRDYDEFVRVEGRTVDGRPGTSRPVDPARLAPERAASQQRPTRQERDARRREREEDLRALIGQRVRIRWPNGHERIGVVRERKDTLHTRPRIVLEDHISLHELEYATAVDTPDRGLGFKAVATASDWTAR